MIEKKPPTEGEGYIIEWLIDMGIKYETQVDINGLKNDNSSFRRADLYLPNYKVYIEFLGKWNSGEKYREGYRQKKAVFEENDIPCIYIYPENLGYIDMILEYRMKKVFKKHGMVKSRKRMEKRNLWENTQTELAVVIFAIIALFNLPYAIVILLLLQLNSIFTSVNRFFHKKREIIKAYK